MNEIIDLAVERRLRRPPCCKSCGGLSSGAEFPQLPKRLGEFDYCEKAMCIPWVRRGRWLLNPNAERVEEIMKQRRAGERARLREEKS